jgi:uncharacterized protein
VKKEEERKMLLDRIKDDIRKAMFAKDDNRKNILRVVVGEVQRKSFVRGTTEDDIYKVIRKLIEGNNETLKFMLPSDVKSMLCEENEILNSYLPRLWDQEKIEAFFHGDLSKQIKDAKSEGMAIGIAMKALKTDNAPVDGKDVKLVVQRIRK